MATILSNRCEDKRIEAYADYLCDKDLATLKKACEYCKTSLTNFPSLAEFLSIVNGMGVKKNEEDQHINTKEAEEKEYQRRKEIFLKEFSQDKLDELTSLWIALLAGKSGLAEMKKWGLTLKSFESPALAELEKNFWNPSRMKEKMLLEKNVVQIKPVDGFN